MQQLLVLYVVYTFGMIAGKNIGTDTFVCYMLKNEFTCSHVPKHNY